LFFFVFFGVGSCEKDINGLREELYLEVDWTWRLNAYDLHLYSQEDPLTLVMSWGGGKLWRGVSSDWSLNSFAWINSFLVLLGEFFKGKNALLCTPPSFKKKQSTSLNSLILCSKAFRVIS
jgi:hypothetical protein